MGQCVGPDLPGAWGFRTRTPRLEARLGKLVQFNKRGRAGKARAEAPQTGQVVLFTGVRYERDDSPLPDKPVGAASRTKKRRA
jgi:hypothetical protein